jgi:hypothetical protein
MPFINVLSYRISPLIFVEPDRAVSPVLAGIAGASVISAHAAIKKV